MKDVPFTDQRKVKDADFHRDLRLPGKAGKDLKAALKTKDWTRCREIVAQHFRTRDRPRWPFYMHGTAWMEIDGRGSVIDKAENYLRDRFRNSWVPCQYEDLRRKSGDPDLVKGLRTMSTSMGRNSFVSDLTTAFSLTGKLAYLEKSWATMRQFMTQFPFVLEKGFFEDHDRYFGGRANATLTVAYRCLRWTDFLHSGALQIPGFLSDGGVVRLVKQLWFYAMQYARFCGDAMRRDNHHLVDHGHLPFVMGVAFPEFGVAREMLRQGQRTIAFHFKNNIFADGGYAEHSTKYQYHILYHYLHPLALARANGVRLFTQAQLKRLERWVEFSARSCKPDGILADFGDETGGSMAYLFGSLATPVMSKRLVAMARALGYEPGRLETETPASLTRRMKTWKPGKPTNIGLSPYYTSKGKLTRPVAKDLPGPASIQYPKGGYTFFRSGWSAGDDFLGIAHYTDCMPHGHTHWDMISFLLHTQGETLIGDPASHLYQDPRIHGANGQELRGYLYSVDAHNCLVMNDDTLKPLKSLGHHCCWGGYPPKHGLGLFRAGGPIEIAEIWHDAYAPTRHRRYAVHFRGLGFAFVDLLSRPGLDLRPHQYSQSFHFECEVDIAPRSPGEGKALIVSRGRARCVIVPGAETETYWKTWKDERIDRIRRHDRSGRAPWIAELTRHQQGPSVFSTFILTGPGSSRSARSQYLGARSAQRMLQQHDGFSANRLSLGKAGTLLLASCPYGKALESDEMSTDAELAAAVLDSKGRVKSWCLAKGSRLAIGGRKLVKGKKRGWLSCL